MGKTKALHHKGDYHRRSAHVRAVAYANPSTRCWRCRLTLSEIRAQRPRARWTAGHLVDGQAGGQLLPECSPCNYAAGARKRNGPRHSSARW